MSLLLFNIPDDSNFEPSSETKELWLSTHKTPNEVVAAPISLPGLYQTTGFTSHVVGVIGILLLEGMATAYAVFEGVLIVAVFMAIIVDFAFAFFSHLPQKSITKLRNRRVWDLSFIPRILLDLDNHIRIQRFWFTLIWISAAFKVFCFITVYPILDITSIFISVCYATGAALHIYCTGYAIFEYRFGRRMAREYRVHIRNPEVLAYDSTNPIPVNLDSAHLNAAESLPHRINNSTGNWQLQTCGLLEDRDFHRLVSLQLNQIGKRDLAIMGTKQQMVLGGLNPVVTP